MVVVNCRNPINRFSVFSSAFSAQRDPQSVPITSMSPVNLIMFQETKPSAVIHGTGAVDRRLM